MVKITLADNEYTHVYYDHDLHGLDTLMESLMQNVNATKSYLSVDDNDDRDGQSFGEHTRI